MVIEWLDELHVLGGQAPVADDLREDEVVGAAVLVPHREPLDPPGGVVDDQDELLVVGVLLLGHHANGRLRGLRCVALLELVFGDLDQEVLGQLLAAEQEFLDNPFPTYRLLRENDPVHLNPDGTYFLTRYEDVVKAFRHPKMSSDKKIDFKLKFDDGPLYTHHTTSLVFNDDPYHARVRKLMAEAFTPRKMDELGPDSRFHKRAESKTDLWLWRLEISHRDGSQIFVR